VFWDTRKEQLMRRSIFSRFGTTAVVACAAVGALAFAGCGGGSDSTTTGASGASGASGTALSQDELVSQANAACKEANDKVAALKAPAQGDLSAAGDTVVEEIAIITPTISTLSGLTPPSDMQADYSAWLSDQKAQVALATQFASVAKSGDTAKAQALASQIEAGSTKNDSEAKALGLTECAKNVSPQG
jgi:hypothetical protein